MALLDVTEYSDLSLDSLGNPIQTGKEPALVQQQVTFTTTTQSAAFQESTRYVRIHSDAAARIAFGENPTATGASMRIAAGATEFFGVKRGPNATMKVAAVTTT